jgi:hypothetical protein
MISKSHAGLKIEYSITDLYFIISIYRHGMARDNRASVKAAKLAFWGAVMAAFIIGGFQLVDNFIQNPQEKLNLQLSLETCQKERDEYKRQFSQIKNFDRKQLEYLLLIIYGARDFAEKYDKFLKEQIRQNKVENSENIIKKN